ncbi:MULTISPECIES: Hsp70 family protein [Roseateles]|uniref:Hsp70 family protein n=1 Tax=Roseateles albus TaxID=2987525 RepID=A0ABT5KEC6_9BURK|nr:MULTISPECIES: Hsp70 family protein [Roseateles]MCV2358388.1 Hsp70 family protein [Paucibacter sp. TC2R-5]MDC8772282.1 Hsp70 family protein [Roseateles albus]
MPASLSSPSKSSFCAIDFGTSNSAIAIPRLDGSGAMRLVELEAGQTTMPTAVFYYVDGKHDADGPPRAFGRAAVAAYVEGADGRLMRSMKSILGSGLIDQTTDVGGGRGVKYSDILSGYLKRLRNSALAAGAPAPLNKLVLGRPVFFVDGEPKRDAQAQASLEAAAHAVGFDDVHFQFEPIAAAFDFEQHSEREQIVLVADIGGGTSDFSVVRVGPERMKRVDRRDDILANHGVHIAGTDFDRHVELASVLREFGYRSYGPERPGAPAREVPSGVYFDLATWHLINTVYSPGRVAELRNMRSFYGNVQHHQRLMTVVEDHLGHELAGRAEAAKIAVANGGDTVIDLGVVENGLQIELSEAAAVAAIGPDIERIAQAGREAVAQAGLAPDQIDALYFTGGSTGLRLLAERIAADYPAAALARGDRFASVATGLGLHAARIFQNA